MAETTHQQAATPPEPQRGITIDEWMEMLSRGKVEIANGEIVQVSPPNTRHVRIARQLFRLLDSFVQHHNLGEIWTEAPYLLDADERANWVYGSKLPDLSFIQRDRYDTHLAEFGEEGPYRLAPDLAVEIVSPNDLYTDINEKIADYLRYGVRLVWLIEPKQRVIRVFTPDTPDGVTLHEDDTLSGDPVIPGWSATVAQILGPPPPPKSE